jgi:5'-3' exonuclease
MTFPYHLDRVVCDFVLLTSLLHNDYLPGIITNGRLYALEKLISVYKQSLLKMNEYLSDFGKLNLSQMAVFFNELFANTLNNRFESHSEHSDHDDHDSAIDMSDSMSDLTVDSSGYIAARNNIYTVLTSHVLCSIY